MGTISYFKRSGKSYIFQTLLWFDCTFGNVPNVYFLNQLGRVTHLLFDDRFPLRFYYYMFYELKMIRGPKGEHFNLLFKMD